jgi:hypothetical protein
MKKLLLILLCLPLTFSSCENKKNTSLDININELEDPCDFINALSEVTQDMYNLGEENKWTSLSEGSKEQAKDLQKKYIEIRSAGWEHIGSNIFAEPEQEECGITIRIDVGAQGEKLADWIDTFWDDLE